MTVTCEPAVEADIEAIFALNKKLIDEYEDTAAIDYPAVLGWVDRNIRENIGSFRRILAEGELAGYYCLAPAGDKMELDSLFVLGPFQGQGIGTAILRQCQADSPSLFLYVFRRNLRAIALYERMGFQITKEVGKTRCIMEYQNQGC